MKSSTPCSPRLPSVAGFYQQQYFLFLSLSLRPLPLFFKLKRFASGHGVKLRCSGWLASAKTLHRTQQRSMSPWNLLGCFLWWMSGSLSSSRRVTRRDSRYHSVIILFSLREGETQYLFFFFGARASGSRCLDCPLYSPIPACFNIYILSASSRRRPFRVSILKPSCCDAATTYLSPLRGIRALQPFSWCCNIGRKLLAENVRAS